MRSSRSWVLTACGLACAVALSAQGQQTGGNTTGGTTGNTTTRQGGQQSSPNQNQGNIGNTNRNEPFGTRSQDPFAERDRPLYLHGRVLTEQGQPPSEPVVIQRVCTGSTYPEGYTDRKGRFSFQVGGDMTMLTTDASVSGVRLGGGPSAGGLTYNNDGVRSVGLGRYDLSACVLRAELSGYRSVDLQLGMYNVMGENNVGTIYLTRLDGLVGHVVSAQTLAAPPKARKAYESGLREMRKNKPNFKKGVAQFEKAVEIYPEFAAAWASMGDAKFGAEDPEGARDAYFKAVETDPKYLKPYEPLIRMAVDSGDWKGMESLGTSYLELNPNASNVRFLTAVAALNVGNAGKAEEMVLAMREGENAEKFPQSYQIMALIHEKRAEFEKAAAQYRTFLDVTAEPDSSNVSDVRRKLKEWEMLGVIQPLSQ